MLLRPAAELWIVPARGGETRRLECNLSPMNSWHCLAANGRWLFFSSNALGAYTKAFLAHVDAEGPAAPPVLRLHYIPANPAVSLPEFLPSSGPIPVRIIMSAVDGRWLISEALVRAAAGDYNEVAQLIRDSLALNDDVPDPHTVHRYLLDVTGRPAER